ncbi:hypothetical protein ACHAXR_006221 [Thalassiosira sp. AJA248-18]
MMAKAAEKSRLEEERAAAQAAHEKTKAERIEKERLEVEAAKRAESKRLEKERIERERALEVKQQKEETARRLAELEQERLAAEEAARQAESEKEERERIERDRRLEEQRQLQIEKEKLAAAEEEAKRVELARLEKKRIERERQLEEQRQNETQRAREESEAEAERLEKERLERQEREHIAAGEQALVRQDVAQVAANEAELIEKMHSQKLLLEKTNKQAKESAYQLALVQQERNQFQNSNQELQTMCEQLKEDLHRAAETISTLRESAADQEDKERLRWEQEAKRVEEEESTILAAAKADMEKQVSNVRESMASQIKSLELELIEERKLSVDQQHELQQRLEEATARLSMSESEMSALLSKKEAKSAKQLQASEKAAAKAVALLDKKEEEAQQLQQVIADMRETMKKNKLEEEDAEEEMDELHHENEELHQQLETLKKENKEMKVKLSSMSDDSEKLGGLKLELQMLEEERRREKSALESAHEKTSEDHAIILSERDATKAQVRDLEQLLTAARADLEMANTDRNRALMANENLQRALEDLQSERDAEIALLSEQQTAAEEAIAAAHEASLEAMKEANAAEMRDIQYAADKSLQNSLVEMDKMESTIQECRKDNLNLRKALDEAIARLQTNQEDVIDRSLIKNIILDWHSKKGKSKRDVMVLLGSILHFTEDEKDKAFVGDGPGALDKVYGAVAAPLPPAKLNVDKIEGDTVREKWVNFLLAETGEDEDRS